MSINYFESAGIGNANRILVVKIPAGVDLLKAIYAAVKKYNIKKGTIVSGVGALKKAVFRNVNVYPDEFPITPSHRRYMEWENPMELVSLTGWIAPDEDGQEVVHAHFSASSVVEDQYPEIVTMGGHLKEGTITWIKVVVTILIHDTEMVVKFDEEIKGTKLHVR